MDQSRIITAVTASSADPGPRPAGPRLACIGAGAWGKNLIRNFAELGSLAAICDIDPSRRAHLAAQYPGATVTARIGDVLADAAIDAVAIATPAETHASIARAALEAGKDVFVEKPLALDLDDGHELVALASDAQRILMVGHLLWYHPAVVRLHELVQNGDLGRIRYIYSNRLNFGKIRREENILWSFAPHDVSVVLGLVGEMPEAVSARGGNYLHDRVADVTVSTLSFPSGVKGHIFVSWLHPFKEQKLVVVGDRKMAVFNDMEPHAKLTVYPHEVGWRNGAAVANKADGEVVPIEATEPLRAECQHFLDCVTTRRTPRTDGREGLRVLRVLQACEQELQGAHAPPVLRQPEPEGVDPKPYQAHETAWVDDGVEIGEGTTIWHFTHLMPGTTVGRACRIGQNVVIGPNVSVGDQVKIQNNVSVYEGVTLEDHVFCGPSMVFTNVMNPRSEIRRMDELRRTLVRRGASLGANCTIVCGITIGRYAFIGAGAVVLRDIPDYALVVGNPGKVIGWMCECGNRIRFQEDGDQGACIRCERLYSRSGDTVAPLDAEPAVAGS